MFKTKINGDIKMEELNLMDILDDIGASTGDIDCINRVLIQIETNSTGEES